MPFSNMRQLPSVCSSNIPHAREGEKWVGAGLDGGGGGAVAVLK